MFDFSLTELALVAVVAVLFIGPKELPTVVRAVAKFMRGLRSIMREITGAFDDVAKESGVKDMVDEFEGDVRMIRGDDGKMYESFDMPDNVKEVNDERQ
ncbi:MAG: Sec-independent protein translocase subunit TatA/TatB [Rickettsiales bacterium]